jgi:hypothetical protein
MSDVSDVCEHPPGFLIQVVMLDPDLYDATLLQNRDKIRGFEGNRLSGII